MKKILFVGNTALVINSFLKGYILSLSQEYSVYVLYNFKTDTGGVNFPSNIHFIHYDIKRKYAFSDIFFLFFLLKLFRSVKFDTTISITPKVGFITNLTAYLSGVEIRIHFFTGQVWITMTGISRIFFKVFDRMLFLLTTYRFIDSPSQLEFLRTEGFGVEKNTFVGGFGSICGVDMNRFYRNLDVRSSLRNSLNINDKVVLLFMGRKVIDKGVVDLIEAFDRIDREDLSLLLVGPDEMNLDLLLKQYRSYGRVISIGMTSRPEDYFSAGDIFCYPSYREGFGLSAIEAAACELPVIGSDIVGLIDAVSNKETGFLVRHKCQLHLQEVINLLVDNPELRGSMGSNGRAMVSRRFRKEFVEGEYISKLREIIS
jgi:glycosyltransferase involved in cell wall biosynthesis